MQRNKSLLEKIANFENLSSAFKECSRGKRKKTGFQNFIFNYGEKLRSIEDELLENHTFNWAGYREFEVRDPKKRTIMAAPFRDRIVHTAIHRVINPIIDPSLGVTTYACRNNMGNRNAVIDLKKYLQQVQKNRYCIKLDVSKYFAHIDHQILISQLNSHFEDSSINQLIGGLIASHPRLRKEGKGIPIGNLTSQLFANLYLSPLDKLACKLLDLNYYQDGNKDNFYLRYMDDMVIISPSKTQAFKCANALISYSKNFLNLSIPNRKKVILANDPIPFLGFVLDSNSHRVLARNNRKLRNKIQRMDKAGAGLSDKAMVNISYNAWKNLED